MEIILKGSGAFPKLIFDRREVILPPVPCNTVSKSTFRIINDGYENLNLKHYIPQEVSNLNIELIYLDGKNIGVTKSQLKMEIYFKSKKPISFSTRIEFFDDSRVYSIQLSGTADNSLFSSFSFLQRTSLDEYRIYCEENKPITLSEEFADTEFQSSPKNNQFTPNNQITPGNNQNHHFNFNMVGSAHSVKSSKSSKF